ncbi:uncharacterized protein LOC111805711 [Cucurbita pepo subsp. pepo]|uniref:uncharacterized protein LOC111805711 n=1 Tax=Cucurbita pepo subsp. pepo TaxID=3664 RepID=UPI000C9D3286|nr:uncharacterized protein LOC111805711 [Cucurbita pepo subsp. pepo]
MSTIGCSTARRTTATPFSCSDSTEMKKNSDMEKQRRPSLQRNATVLCSIINHSTSSSVASSGGSSSVEESELGGGPSEPQHHQSFKTVFKRHVAASEWFFIWNGRAVEPRGRVTCFRGLTI